MRSISRSPKPDQAAHATAEAESRGPDQRYRTEEPSETRLGSHRVFGAGSRRVIEGVSPLARARAKDGKRAVPGSLVAAVIICGAIRWRWSVIRRPGWGIVICRRR